MTALLLSLLIYVTPTECEANHEWCVCRRYITKDLNACEVKAKDNSWKHNECKRIYEVGKVACLKNDGDMYDDALRENTSG